MNIDAVTARKGNDMVNQRLPSDRDEKPHLRLLFILHPSSFILVFLLSAGGCQRGASEPILVGHLATLSGSSEAAGQHAQQGIALAVEEANKEENRIDGRRLAVLHVDTHGNKEALQAEAVRLVTVNHVAGLLGGTDAAELDVLVPDAQRYGLPLLTPGEQLQPAATDQPKTAAADSVPVFSLDVAPAYRGQILARFTSQELKAESIMVLKDQRYEAGKILVVAFLNELKDKGIRVEERIYQGEIDFADLVVYVGNAKPGAVLIVGRASDLAKLRPKLRTAGVQAPVLCGCGEQEVAALLADPNARGGMIVATAYLAADGTPREPEFVKVYREHFHQEPDVHALLGYASARLLFESMHRVKSPAASKVRDELNKFDNCDSLAGPLSLGKDHAARRTVFIIRLEAEGPKEAKRYEPAEK